jgi:hypothetical protein
LPSYDRTNICFHLINREEESSKVSSVLSVSKPDYVEKMPFKSLPPKGGSKKSKKKKKKRSKRREEMVSSPKHVAPIIDYDNSNLDDVPMPVTYVSDHDWEKHSTFDIENLFGTDSKNYKVNNYCTISTIHVPSYDDMFDEYALQHSCSLAYDDTKPLVYDGYDDEYNIFSSPTVDGFRVARTRGTSRRTQRFERRGLNVGDLGSQRNTVTEASRHQMHHALQRETPSLTQVQGPRGEVKPLLPAFLYYDAIPREEYKALVIEL